MADCCTDVAIETGWLGRLIRRLTTMRLAPPLSDEQAKLLASVKLPCC